jgi:hypothetical protein
MTALPLRGLKGTEPIGYLAALGLLRVLSKRNSLGFVKLSWSDDSVWSAILHTENACDDQLLIDELLGHMRGRAAFPVFAGVEPACDTSTEAQPWRDVKVSCKQFADMLRAVRLVADVNDREAADFYSAFGSELIPLNNKDVVKPSALHMTSGNQAFLESTRELARSLDACAPPHSKSAVQPEEAFREALFDRRSDGTQGWQAADEFSSMGFDAAREAIYALTATAPTSTGPRSTRGAVWLAIEAIPLFPTLPAGRHLHTRGFTSDRRTTTFRWPIWNGNLSIDCVRTALALPEVLDEDITIERLQQLAIRAVMQSERVSIGQGYGQLRPAVRVH